MFVVFADSLAAARPSPALRVPPPPRARTQVFSKLHNFIGQHVKSLIDRPDELYAFRLHKNKVYYVSEGLVRRATSVAREHLVSLGTCLGRFTKSGHFRLAITSLEILAAYAKHKVRAEGRAGQPAAACRAASGSLTLAARRIDVLCPPGVMPALL